MNSDDDKLNNAESDQDKDHSLNHQNENSDSSEHQNSESEDQTEPEQEIDSQEGEKEPHKNIFRSKSNRIFLGVCSGLSAYFDTDPLFFRLAFILSIIFGFWGIIFYLILGIVIPEEPGTVLSDDSQRKLDKENHKVLIGSSLILLGIFLIVKNTRLFYFFQVWSFFAKYLIPTALIISGLYLLLRRKPLPAAQNRKLYRSILNRKIAGVCSGLGEYLDVDPTIIRILWLVFVFSSFGVGVLVYLLFAVMVPEKQDVDNEDPSEYN